MKKAIKCIIYVFFVITASSLLWAGNREMIGNRVDELDKLNKEAVKQIAGQPEKGKINIKIRVIPEKDGYRFEPVGDEKTSSKQDVLLPQTDENKFFSFLEGIARIVRKKPSITPYKSYAGDGEYVSFKDSVVRLSRSKK